MTTLFTDARRQALDVLAEKTGPGGVRISNRTAGAPDWSIHFQAAEWLARRGFAEIDVAWDGTECAWITAQGRAAAK